MTKSTIAGLTGLAIVLGFCGTSLGQKQSAAQAPAESENKPVPFETIKFGSFGFGRHRENTQYEIRSEKDWELMWRYAHGLWPEEQVPRRHPLPPIDFKKEMILAAFQGTCPSTGYSVRIEQVRDAGDKLIAVVKQRTPAPDQIVGHLITYPSHLIRLPKSDKPVCFQVMTIKHPIRVARKPSDGPIHPDIYREFKSSPDGKASMWIILKQPEMLHGATMEDREKTIKNLHDSVFSKLKPDEFEYGEPLGGKYPSLSARLNASGLEKLSKDPNFESAMFEGRSSLPEEFEIEQDCE